MKSDLRILFMGTPPFAVTVLEKIIDAKYNMVGVVTAPDKPAGRGRKLKSSAVAEFAQKQQLNILQPTNLKSETFINNLKQLDIDIIVVVAFRMLPQSVWEIPTIGTFNLHASLLPNYRGAAPINWAIINGENQTGVTTFFINEEIDKGNILLKKEVDILPDETAGELHDKLMHTGAELVIETLKGLDEKTLTPVPQPQNGDWKPAPKIFKEDGRIDWKDSLENIYNKIRGFSPYPASWTIFNLDDQTKTLKLFRARLQYDNHFQPTGKFVFVNSELAITHKEGYLFITELQLEGKRRMSVKDFTNGISSLEKAFVA